MMTFRRRTLAAILSAGLFVTGCSTKGSDPMLTNDPSQSTGPTASTTYACSGYKFALQPTGQRILGTNGGGATSMMVLMGASADVDPQVALVSPVFDGDELVMDPVDFKLSEPQTFSGVGTVTLLEVPSKDNATFCFEPESGFTPDSWFEANQ